MITAVMPTYGRTDFALVKGEGAYVYADDGRRFLDFGSGIAVASLGHCHPKLVEALRAQAGELWHCSNLYRIEGQERAAATLVENSFADTVFFNNSGAEALECAIKLMRRYQHGQGRSERFRVICVEGAFHGRTLATIAAGGQAKHLEGFGPAVDGFDHVPFGDLAQLEAAITPQTAGILLEPIQGEGGIRPVPEAYMKAVRKLCDDQGLLLAFDEVQCGIGRTGKLFAHEWSGITPDVLASAKGLGGGFPVGACLATEAAAEAMVAGTHGSTFGGNPLAMAVVNAVLDTVLAPGFLARVSVIAAELQGGLEDLASRFPKVLSEVRGRGLMLGLKCVDSNLDLVAKLAEEGILTVPAGDNIVRMIPPLIIDETHVREALEALERALEAVAAAHEKGAA